MNIVKFCLVVFRLEQIRLSKFVKKQRGVIDALQICKFYLSYMLHSD